MGVVSFTHMLPGATWTATYLVISEMCNWLGTVSACTRGKGLEELRRIDWLLHGNELLVVPKVGSMPSWPSKRSKLGKDEPMA